MSTYNIKAQFLHSMHIELTVYTCIIVMTGNYYSNARSNILHNNKICYIYYLPLRITKNNYNITKLTTLIALVYRC